MLKNSILKDFKSFVNEMKTGIVNFSDLHDNWSAEYHLSEELEEIKKDYKKLGRKGIVKKIIKIANKIDKKTYNSLINKVYDKYHLRMPKYDSVISDKYWSKNYYTTVSQVIVLLSALTNGLQEHKKEILKQIEDLKNKLKKLDNIDENFVNGKKRLGLADGKRRLGLADGKRRLGLADGKRRLDLADKNFADGKWGWGNIVFNKYDKHKGDKFEYIGYNEIPENGDEPIWKYDEIYEKGEEIDKKDLEKYISLNTLKEMFPVYKEDVDFFKDWSIKLYKGKLFCKQKKKMIDYFMIQQSGWLYLFRKID